MYDFPRDPEMAGRTPWKSLHRPVKGTLRNIFLDGSFRVNQRRRLVDVGTLMPVRIYPFEQDGSPQVSVTLL